MTEKKIKYQKPAMRVYELTDCPELLVGSGLNNPSDYPNGGDPFSF